MRVKVINFPRNRTWVVNYILTSAVGDVWETKQQNCTTHSISIERDISFSIVKIFVMVCIRARSERVITKAKLLEKAPKDRR